MGGTSNEEKPCCQHLFAGKVGIGWLVSVGLIVPFLHAAH